MLVQTVIIDCSKFIYSMRKTDASQLSIFSLLVKISWHQSSWRFFLYSLHSSSSSSIEQHDIVDRTDDDLIALVFTLRFHLFNHEYIYVLCVTSDIMRHIWFLINVCKRTNLLDCRLNTNDNQNIEMFVNKKRKVLLYSWISIDKHTINQLNTLIRSMYVIDEIRN
jgi:hypothetical protein